MVIGPHDEIFVLYSNYSSCGPPYHCTVELTVERYTPDGQRDLSFGAGASPQLVVRQTSSEHEFDLAVGPEGKPVVAAFDESPGGGLVVVRLGLDGHLDSTFGAGGRAAHPETHQIEDTRGTPVVAVQADGKVIVAREGNREWTADPPVLLARYLPDGEFDPGFGDDGEAALSLGTRSAPDAILLDPSGTITVPGSLCCSSGSLPSGEGVSVSRLLGGGQLDPNWAGVGSLILPTPGAQGRVEGAAIAPDGSIFLSIGESTPAVTTIGNLVKLTPSGDLDPGFGNGGRLRLFTRVGFISPTDLAVDHFGRLVGVGWAARMAAFRLRPDGSADRTFNGGQALVLPFGGDASGTTPYMVAIQPSGRIIAFGDSGAGSKRLGLIALRGGTDHTRCLGHAGTIVGTDRNDQLIGTPHRDVIAALGGRDEVRGLGGPDLICGGKGKDKLLGGPGRDQIQD
jgi:uncharacterized delta-60 repeat protein